jgi:hypothetical protein
MVPGDWLAAGAIGRLASAKVEHQRDINGLYPGSTWATTATREEARVMLPHAMWGIRQFHVQFVASPLQAGTAFRRSPT